MVTWTAGSSLPDALGPPVPPRNICLARDSSIAAVRMRTAAAAASSGGSCAEVVTEVTTCSATLDDAYSPKHAC